MDYLEKGARVLEIEIFELQRLRQRLGKSFGDAIELLKATVDARGKIVVRDQRAAGDGRSDAAVTFEHDRHQSRPATAQSTHCSVEASVGRYP